jgi:hypothetical protein
VRHPLCAASPLIHLWSRIAARDRGRRTHRLLRILCAASPCIHFGCGWFDGRSLGEIAVAWTGTRCLAGCVDRLIAGWLGADWLVVVAGGGALRLCSRHIREAEQTGMHNAPEAVIVYSKYGATSAAPSSPNHVCACVPSFWCVFPCCAVFLLAERSYITKS